METLHFIADKVNLRLDKYLSLKYDKLSRAYFQRLIREGYVTVNGLLAKASLKLKVGDKVAICFPPSPSTSLTPESIPLAIIYEDEDLIVIDKLAGIPVHPGAGHPSHTIVNALLAHCPEIASLGDSVRPGIVHRLDKDTSGLMAVAKNPKAQLYLSRQLSSRSIIKRYLVLVQGRLSPEQGEIEAPIGRHPRNRKKFAVIPGGREARTLYRVIKYLDNYTLVEATLDTGRTHQLRVHFSFIGYPVVGDATYGVKSPYLSRQFVHAYLLRLRLPSTGEYREFMSELPADLEQALEQLSG